MITVLVFYFIDGISIGDKTKKNSDFVYSTCCMQIIKTKVSQAVQFLKKNDLWAKIAFTIIFLSYLFFVHSCTFNPLTGRTYPIYENKYPGYSYKDKGAKQCELDGKKLFLKKDNVIESFGYYFFVDSKAFFVWHLQYQDDDNVLKNILTYRFERIGDGAIGNLDVLTIMGIGIDERKDSIVIIYEEEPFDGFTIEPGPFSDKIVLQKSASEKDIISAHCAWRDYN